jgi:hypothetical protein
MVFPGFRDAHSPRQGGGGLSQGTTLFQRQIVSD